MFKDQWETQVRLLTEAVDEITTIDDFLAVSGRLHVFIYLLVKREINSKLVITVFLSVCFKRICPVLKTILNGSSFNMIQPPQPKTLTSFHFSLGKRGRLGGWFPQDFNRGPLAH